MKRPSWPTIILGFLNIIAAGFLMSLAVKDFYARVAWARHLDDGQRIRDGLVRTNEFEDQDETDKVIDGLSEEGKNKVKALAYKSRYALRRAGKTWHAQSSPSLSPHLPAQPFNPSLVFVTSPS